MIDPGTLSKAGEVAEKLCILAWLSAKVKQGLVRDRKTAAWHLSRALLEENKTMETLRNTILEIGYLFVPRPEGGRCCTGIGSHRSGGASCVCQTGQGELCKDR